jgi:hypothetical protein
LIEMGLVDGIICLDGQIDAEVDAVDGTQMD